MPLFIGNPESEEQFSLKQASISKQFEIANALNNYNHIGNFLTNHILLWKEDMSEKISGHIILFYAENVYEQVITLLLNRTKKPIIYYSQAKPDERWNRFAARLPNIYYAQGDYFDLTHLRNCAIEKAFHVCIFNSITLSMIEANTPECLLLANLLDDYFNVNYTIEVNDQNEMKFLGNKPRKNMLNFGFQFYPKFIAGELSVLNILDSLISFSTSNPTSLDVFIHMFVFNENRRNHGDKNTEWETQNINVNITENLEIKTIKCPELYYNKIYSELVYDFCSLKPSVIPIGLITYRYSKIKKEKTNNIKKNNHNYSVNYFNAFNEQIKENLLPGQLTLTNPLPTTVLNENDQIIVIGNFNENISPTNFNEKNTEHFKEPESVLLENFFVQDHKNDENQKLLSLLRLTLSGRNKIYKKIEEKNYMIKNLMQEIEKKKKNYVRFLEKD